MSDGFRPITLDDPSQGEIKLMVVVPHKGDPWGVLAALRGTPWAEQLSVVSGEVMSHALHGWATPLMRVIGPEPKYRGLHLPKKVGGCALKSGCILSSPKCRPGKKPPMCYEPMSYTGEIGLALTTVVMSWTEGRYVVIVEGDGFVLA